MGWFQKKEPDVHLPSQASLETDPRSRSIFVHTKIQGEWHKRVAYITSTGFLILYKTETMGKVYDLKNMDSFEMKYKKKDIKLNFKTSSGKKLKMKLMGPDANLWAAKIIQLVYSLSGKRWISYEEELKHDGHAGDQPRVSDPWNSAKDGFTSSASLNSVGSRFSYSLPLNTSNESLSRKIHELRGSAGQSDVISRRYSTRLRENVQIVHSILTDKSLSDRERHRRLHDRLGSLNPISCLSSNLDMTLSTDSLNSYAHTMDSLGHVDEDTLQLQ